MTPIALSRHAVHLVITFFYSDSWILSVVYNPQVLDGQVKVWNDLSKLARLQLPWVVTGDFNAVVRTEKHGGGASTIM